MKVIFSRKGFDSTAGGHPNPILADGTFVPFPIPETVGHGVPYTELRLRDGRTYAELMQRLGIPIPPQGGHADPDVEGSTRPRLEGWRPLFGPATDAQTHLIGNGVGHDDIFLFYGWFRPSDDLGWQRPRRDLHVIWGYLQVGERWDDGACARAPAWAKQHPHIAVPARYGPTTVYVARERLSLDASLPGAVLLRFNESLVLTEPGSPRSVWRLPGAVWPEGTTPALSQRSDPKLWSRNGDGTVSVRTQGYGQELVLDANAQVLDWVIELLRAGTAARR